MESKRRVNLKKLMLMIFSRTANFKRETIFIQETSPVLLTQIIEKSLKLKTDSYLSACSIKDV